MELFFWLERTEDVNFNRQFYSKNIDNKEPVFGAAHINKIKII